MKNLQSIEEGKWSELVSGELTEAQKKLLASTNPADKEAKEALIAELKTRKPKTATKADATKAQAKYEEVKPVIEEGETYEFIGINVMLDGDSVSGVLNCRVNEEHKQIRF